MKKLTSLFLTIIMTLSLISVPVFADEEIKIYVDGQQLYTDVAPVMINDRVLVPVRAIGEALGLKVTWREEWQTAFLKNEYLTVSIVVDDTRISKSYNPIQIDCPAQLINDRILVPVRAVSEAFNSNVSYDEATNSVYIYSDNSNVKRLDLTNGAYYIGEVADGFRDGYGTTYNANGNWTEFGLYKRGVLNGRGMRRNNDNSDYLGDFVGGVPNGMGQYYPDNNKNDYIKGNFVNGLIEGEGYEYDENGNLVSKCNYLHGARNGYGEEYDIYGSVLYAGEYINGERANNYSVSPSQTTASPTTGSIPYYAEMPEFPDFGAITGAKLLFTNNESDDKMTVYAYAYDINSPISDNGGLNYFSILDELGFKEYTDSQTDEENLLKYERGNGKYIIYISLKDFGGYYYIICFKAKDTSNSITNNTLTTNTTNYAEYQKGLAELQEWYKEQIDEYNEFVMYSPYFTPESAEAWRKEIDQTYKIKLNALKLQYNITD